MTGSTHEGLRVGIDIGGTNVEGVAIDESGAVVAHCRFDTVKGADGVVGVARAAVCALTERVGCAPGSFGSVGVGIPGSVDRAAGIVHHAVNLSIETLPLAALLAAEIAVPVQLENDVRAAALGTWHVSRSDRGGSDHGSAASSLAYLNLGTGLAAGIVHDGAVIHGVTGVAGEIGHLAIDPLGRSCLCGQRGCLETVASGSALSRFWPGAGTDPGRALAAALAVGDPGAREAFANLTRGAAECVRILALSFDPSRIVVGGGLRHLGVPLLEGIAAHLTGWAVGSPFLSALALPSRLRLLPEGSHAAAVGAALGAAPLTPSASPPSPVSPASSAS